jgi:hypothetical protein
LGQRAVGQSGRHASIAGRVSRADPQPHTAHAIAVLVRALDDDDARVRVAAANELLDRGHGKPASVADVTLRHGVDLAAAHLEVLAELVGATTIESETPTDN